MGETPAQTLTEIEATRAAIDRDLSVLESRLPDREEIAGKAKAAGGAAAGGLALLTVMGVTMARRKRERELRAEAQRQAEALATHYPHAFGGAVEPDHGSRKPLVALLGLAAGAGVGYALFRREDVQAKAEQAMARARESAPGSSPD